MKLLKRTYTDKEIINRLTTGTHKEIEKWEIKVYDLYKSKMKGFCKKKFQEKFNAEIFKEAYNDAFISFLFKIRQSDFKLSSQLSSFFTTFVKFKYHNIIRSNKNNMSIDDDKVLLIPESKIGILQELIVKEKLGLVKEILAQSGKNCLQIILMKFAEGYSYKEIAVFLGLKNEDVVKRRKYVCMKNFYIKYKELKH